MKNSNLDIPAPAEVVQSARSVVLEIEREIIMLTFKFASPLGDYNDAEVVQSARSVVLEIEREIIMLTFKFASPLGDYNDEIRDIAYIGWLTVRPTRDLMFMNNLRYEVKKLSALLDRADSYITLKRLNALRQRWNGLLLNNQNASRSRTSFTWNQKSGRFLAGKILSGIMNKHLPRDIFSLADQNRNKC